MIRHHPTDNEVREAMNTVLREAEESGRHPRISAVERLLGVSHATFYRNYSDLIEEFRVRTYNRHEMQTKTVKSNPTPADAIARLRREKDDARRTVAVYAETIRQLTTGNEKLRAKLQRLEGVTDLSSRRNNRP